MDDARRDRVAGTLWAASSALSVALMAIHPVARRGELADVVASIVAIAWRERLVHGGLIALMGVGLLGWWRLFERLDLRAATVRVAALAVVAGTLAYVGAALVNGFVVASLAERYARETGAALEPFRDLIRLTWEMNQVFAKAGVLAMGIALAGSGLALRRYGGAPLLAWSGLLLGVVMAAGSASGHLQLHLHVMLAIVVGQAAWSIATAIQLRRGRFAG